MLALSTAAIARLFGVGADWTGAIVERESRLDAAWYSMWRKRGWKITGSKKVIKWGWRKMSTFYMIDSETPYLLPSRSGSDRFWAEKKKRAEPPTSCFPRRADISTLEKFPLVITFIGERTSWQMRFASVHHAVDFSFVPPIWKHAQTKTTYGDHPDHVKTEPCLRAMPCHACYPYPTIPLHEC